MSPYIYLCGPMTGLPEYNYPAFHAAAAELRAQGWHVVKDRTISARRPAHQPPANTFGEPIADTLPHDTASPIRTSGRPLTNTVDEPALALPPWHFFGLQWMP